MRVNVLLLPRDFRPEHADTAVVVFDVLRATTSIAAALAAGARQVRVFDSIDAARTAAEADTDSPRRLLCGELKCLPPPGFDLGNSPGAFTVEVTQGRMIYLATTNGTRALVAARAARELFTGALVNTRAVTAHLHRLDLDVTLLCAGTEGDVSAEDVLGCGAVIEELRRLRDVHLTNDAALIASKFFAANRQDLLALMRQTRGGRNIIAAGFERDIAFCAALNSLDIVARFDGEHLVVTAAD